MVAATFSAPLVADVPSVGTVLDAPATSLPITDRPANITFSRSGSGWAYAYDGGLPAFVEASVAAHPLVETRSTTIPLTIAPGSGLMPVANAIFVNTGDSKGYEGMDQIAKAISDGGYDADPYGNSGNPDNGIPQSGVGGSQSGSGGTGLTSPTRMAREKAAIAGYAQQGRIVYSGLRMFTNDSFPSVQTSINNLAIWHNEVSRGGGARALVLWGSEPSTNNIGRNTYLVQQNAALKQYALDNAQDTIFIDVYDPLLLKDGSGLGDQQWFLDGVHKNRAGINYLAPFAIPMLNQLCTKKVS